tara:strand:- start:112 stop:483 length:372 start_codon:yes stop_codon:yes gene_type:complete
LKFGSILNLFLGSTIGLILRLYVEKKLKIKTGIYINNISFINISASLFLGVLLALDITNQALFFLFYVGFLGCFSTFSSFIYQLFILIQRRKFILFAMHYIEVLVFSLLSFYMGFFLTNAFKN